MNYTFELNLRVVCPCGWKSVSVNLPTIAYGSIFREELDEWMQDQYDFHVLQEHDNASIV